MNNEKLNIQLKELKNELQEKFSVSKLGVFGSYARNEQNENSDIDILIELEKPIGWKFFTLNDFLSKKLGKKIDLTTENGLRKELREEIMRSVIYIW